MMMQTKKHSRACMFVFIEREIKFLQKKTQKTLK